LIPLHDRAEGVGIAIPRSRDQDRVWTAVVHVMAVVKAGGCAQSGRHFFDNRSSRFLPSDPDSSRPDADYM
jgi:hypothetical protein